MGTFDCLLTFRENFCKIPSDGGSYFLSCGMIENRISRGEAELEIHPPEDVEKIAGRAHETGLVVLSRFDDR